MTQEQLYSYIIRAASG